MFIRVGDSPPSTNGGTGLAGKRARIFPDRFRPSLTPERSGPFFLALVPEMRHRQSVTLDTGAGSGYVSRMSWTGDRIIDRYGYARIKVLAGGIERYVLEHRHIATNTIGRPLAPGEVVHHIDGNKLNNHPTNLQVLPDRGAHRRLHAEENRRAACALENQ